MEDSNKKQEKTKEERLKDVIHELHKNQREGCTGVEIYNLFRDISRGNY